MQAGGALIGPYALGIIQDVESIRHLAELGVVFLLFNIGLELSFDRLRSMQKFVFGMGSAQAGVGERHAWGAALGEGRYRQQGGQGSAAAPCCIPAPDCWPGSTGLALPAPTPPRCLPATPCFPV